MDKASICQSLLCQLLWLHGQPLNPQPYRAVDGIADGWGCGNGWQLTNALGPVGPALPGTLEHLHVHARRVLDGGNEVGGEPVVEIAAAIELHLLEESPAQGLQRAQYDSVTVICQPGRVLTLTTDEAKRYGLVGIREDDAPTAWQIMKQQWFMSLPLVIIVVMMLLGFSPGYAAFWAILSCVGISWFTPDKRMGVKEILNAMNEGARQTIIIGATVGVIGIIVGTIQQMHDQGGQPASATVQAAVESEHPNRKY